MSTFDKKTLIKVRNDLGSFSESNKKNIENQNSNLTVLKDKIPETKPVVQPATLLSNKPDIRALISGATGDISPKIPEFESIRSDWKGPTKIKDIELPNFSGIDSVSNTNILPSLESVVNDLPVLSAPSMPTLTNLPTLSTILSRTA